MSDGLGTTTGAATFHDPALPCFEMPKDRVLAVATSAITASETMAAKDFSEAPGTDLRATDPACYLAALYPFKRNRQIAGALIVFGRELRFSPDIIRLVGRITEDLTFALDGFDQERKRLAAGLLSQADLLATREERPETHPGHGPRMRS